MKLDGNWILGLQMTKLATSIKLNAPVDFSGICPHVSPFEATGHQNLYSFHWALLEQ